MNATTAVLRHERWLLAAALAVLVALAWAWVWDGAGMGMPAAEMTALSLFPHRLPDVPGAMPAPFGLVVAMWWVMMAAMMLPSAAPLVLLYGQVARHHARTQGQALAPASVLLAGYLAAWLGFSVAAAAAQRLLEPSGLLSPMMLWSRSAPLSAAVLAAAGLYQWSPFKQACLRQCRGPVRYLTEHWRPGLRGAFALGLRHGAWCLGCCWMLMALLFVGGIMNLAWIAALTVLVAAEKLLPGGPRVARASGVVLLAWAGATLLA